MRRRKELSSGSAGGTDTLKRNARYVSKRWTLFKRYYCTTTVWNVYVICVDGVRSSFAAYILVYIIYLYRVACHFQQIKFFLLLLRISGYFVGCFLPVIFILIFYTTYQGVKRGQLFIDLLLL